MPLLQSKRAGMVGTSQTNIALLQLKRRQLLSTASILFYLLHAVGSEATYIRYFRQAIRYNNV